MDFRKTQIGCMLEQMKLAMLAHIPVIYIPTDQMELIHEILYSDNTIDSLVPRVKYDSEKKTVVKLADKEYGVKDDEKRTFSSIKDNYLIFVNSIDSDIVRCPSILLTYTTKWDKVETGIRNFISDYMGMKRSKDNNPNPYHVANISRSLCIVVTPTEQVIPENIAPYVMTVRVPALLDEEIEAVIASEFNAESMDISVLRRSEVLYSQMIVSLRGFSVLRIRQLLRQMIASQSIDFNHVNADAVLAAIRVSKKQMLENCNGLKWEETNATNAAGLDSISKWLEERIDIFSDPERAAQCHTDIPNGLLISGIPGSGKSLMAKTAAYKLGLPLISLDMGALLNSLMGESEHNMINALRMSENMAPCVLWIDEIEKAFSGSSQNSSSSDGGVGRRMFGKFLTWMQRRRQRLVSFLPRPMTLLVFLRNYSVPNVLIGNILPSCLRQKNVPKYSLLISRHKTSHIGRSWKLCQYPSVQKWHNSCSRLIWKRILFGLTLSIKNVLPIWMLVI